MEPADRRTGLGLALAFVAAIYVATLTPPPHLMDDVDSVQAQISPSTPYLSSQPLAVALKQAPPGRVVFDDQYYTFSSVFFYADVKSAKILNGRVNNLEYGSYAPGAPDVWLTDAQMPDYWNQPQRTYLLAEQPQVARFEKLLGRERLHVVAHSGGKFLFVNQPLLVNQP